MGFLVPECTSCFADLLVPSHTLLESWISPGEGKAGARTSRSPTGFSATLESHLPMGDLKGRGSDQAGGATNREDVELYCFCRGHEGIKAMVVAPGNPGGVSQP